VGELSPTQDPNVFIEERSPGLARYRNIATGRRWEVHGECVKVGNCQIGSFTNDGRPIPDRAELERLQSEEPGALSWPIDSPITPEFHDCCPFTFVELLPL
jgi:hypothetical protein